MNRNESFFPVFRLPLTLLLLLLLRLPCTASLTHTIEISLCNKFDRPYFRPVVIMCGFSNQVHPPGHSPIKVTIPSNVCKKFTIQAPHGLPIGCSAYADRRNKDPWKNPTFVITDGRPIPHSGKGQKSFPQDSAYDHGKANGFPADQGLHGQNQEDYGQLPSYEEAMNGQSHHYDDPSSHNQAKNGQSTYDEDNENLPPLQNQYTLTLNKYGVNFENVPGKHGYFERYHWPIKYDVYIFSNFHGEITVSCKIDRFKVTQTIHPGGYPMHLPLNMPPNTQKAVGCTVYWMQRKYKNANKYYSFFAFDKTKVPNPIYFIPGRHRGKVTWLLQEDGIYQWNAARRGRYQKVSKWREQKGVFSQYSYKKRTNKPVNIGTKKTYRTSRWDGAGQDQVYQGVNHGY